MNSLLNSEQMRGSVVFIVAIFITFLLIIPVSMSFMKMSSQKTKIQLTVIAQANNVARAGLTDTISWFRRQTSQPVRQVSGMTYADAAFNPQTNSDASLSDTDNATIGIVKEYQISERGALWARYEVRKQSDTSSFPYDSHAVHDISDSRVENATSGQGLAWYIESVGYVFRKNDPDAAFNESPNEVVGTARASTEIRRLSVNLPASAAVIVSTRSAALVNLQSNSRISGGGAIGLGYFSNVSAPTIAGSSITGNPAQASVWQSSVPLINFQTIFGVTISEFRLMADVTCSTFSELSTTYPTMSVVYIRGNAAFDATRKLRGGGILVVDGNIDMGSASNTFFSGVIYASGNCIVRGPASVSGVLICKGSLSMNGAGDATEVVYDSGIINSVVQQVGQYRENKSTYFNFSGLK